MKNVKCEVEIVMTRIYRVSIKAKSVQEAEEKAMEFIEDKWNDIEYESEEFEINEVEGDFPDEP